MNSNCTYKVITLNNLEPLAWKVIDMRESKEKIKRWVLKVIGLSRPKLKAQPNS